MLVLPQCDFCAQHGGFVPREWQAAKGLFQKSLQIEGMAEIQARKSLSKVVFLVILSCKNWYVIKPNRFCYYVKNKGFYRETCVCNSFHISHFYVCRSVVTRGSVFSMQLYYLTHAKKQQWRTSGILKSLKS